MDLTRLWRWIARLWAAPALLPPAPAGDGGGASPLEEDEERAMQRLRASIPGLPRCASPWSDGRPPTSDADFLQHWLVGELEQLARLPSAAESRLLLSQLLRALRQPDLAALPPPHRAVALLDALQDEEASIAEICALAQEDPYLVQRIWSMASSARYASPPRDLQYAIARIGLGAVWKLLAEQLASGRLLPSPARSAAAEALRCHSLHAAQTAGRLAGREGAAYVGGMLNSVGALYLQSFALEDRGVSARLMLKLAHRYNEPLGMLLLLRWGLAPNIAFAVGYQSAPDELPAEERALPRLIRASSVAVHAVQQARRGYDCGGLEALAQIPGISPERCLREALAVVRQSQRPERVLRPLPVLALAEDGQPAG